MIVIKLNCSKIPKERLFIGAKGKYLDLRLVDKPDSYGNAGFVAIDLPREARDRGESGEIVGNWKELGAKKPAPPAARPQPKPRQPDPDLDAPADDDEVPF